jgi:hypothetical protein
MQTFNYSRGRIANWYQLLSLATIWALDNESSAIAIRIYEFNDPDMYSEETIESTDYGYLTFDSRAVLEDYRVSFLKRRAMRVDFVEKKAEGVN